MDILLEFISNLLDYPAPGEKLKELGKLIDDVFQLMPSDKHMVGKNLGRLESSDSLNNRVLGVLFERQAVKNLKTGRSS